MCDPAKLGPRCQHFPFRVSSAVARDVVEAIPARGAIRRPCRPWLYIPIVPEVAYRRRPNKVPRVVSNGLPSFLLFPFPGKPGLGEIPDLTNVQFSIPNSH